MGERFATAARNVTEDDVASFATLTGDGYGLHMDEAVAAAGPYGQRIAHGMLTLSIAIGLMMSRAENGDGPVLAFYGIDRVRFTRPVFFGDTLRVRVEVAGLEERDAERGIVSFRDEIENQDGETVAVMEKRLLYKRRNGS